MRDPENDGKMCGDSQSYAFNRNGSSATTLNCYDSCDSNKDCVAFSGVYGEWCIGCTTELSVPQKDAMAFKKTEPSTADGIYFSI